MATLEVLLFGDGCVVRRAGFDDSWIDCSGNVVFPYRNQLSRAPLSTVSALLVWGVARVRAGHGVVVLVTQASVTTHLFQERHPVHEIDDVFLWPISNVTSSSPETSPTLLHSIRQLFLQGGFFFSPSLDLHRHSSHVWNSSFFLACPPHLTRPIIYGFVCSTPLDLDGSVHASLISRRSRRRAGVRYHRRGADDMGYSANFVEHEQWIWKQNKDKGGGDVCISSSFLQVRGSAALVWWQQKDLAEAGDVDPSIEVDGNVDRNAHVMGKHLEMLKAVGKKSKRQTEKGISALPLHHNGDDEGGGGPLNVLVVSLIRHHGNEGLLRKNISMHIQPSQLLELDMHAHKDLPSISAAIERFVCFDLIGSRMSQLPYHQYLIRTNCKDSVDRTNLVQAEVSRQIIPYQLRECHLNVPEENNYDALQPIRNMWARHGDYMSLQYCGSRSLRSHMLSLSRRWFQPSSSLLQSSWRKAVFFVYSLRDHLTSFTRIYNAVYIDDDKQMAIDALLLNADVPLSSSPSSPSWLKRMLTPSPPKRDGSVTPLSVFLMWGWLVWFGFWRVLLKRK